LKSLGLKVYDLNLEQISEIYILNQTNRSVSTTDLSSYILARDLSAILLSGDGALRKLAKKYAIEVHGALWLLDHLILHGIIPASQAAAVLDRMIERGARFPKNECDKRLKAWQASP
jgi:predicted nucleic acid-binding protein